MTNSISEVNEVEELSLEIELDQENLVKALKALTEAGVDFKLKSVAAKPVVVPVLAAPLSVSAPTVFIYPYPVYPPPVVYPSVYPNVYPTWEPTWTTGGGNGFTLSQPTHSFDLIGWNQSVVGTT